MENPARSENQGGHPNTHNLTYLLSPFLGNRVKLDNLGEANIILGNIFFLPEITKLYILLKKIAQIEGIEVQIIVGGGNLSVSEIIDRFKELKADNTSTQKPKIILAFDLFLADPENILFFTLKHTKNEIEQVCNLKNAIGIIIPKFFDSFLIKNLKMCQIAIPYLEIVAPHPGINSVKLLKDMLETVGPGGEVHLFLPITELFPQNELKYISLYRIPKVAYDFIMHNIINLSTEDIKK